MTRKAPGGTPSPPDTSPTTRGLGIKLEPQITEVSDRTRLEALRGQLEAVLADPATSPRDLAAVSREYRQTLAALSALAPVSGTAALDQIAERRRRRVGESS